MKKFIMTCLVLGIMFAAYSKELSIESLESNDFYKNISYNLLPDDKIAESWYLNKIPKEFGDAFLYYTRSKKEIRLAFFSLMVYESGNFTSMKNVNRDGSIDYGPSQLNSSNMRNKQFQKWYRPKDESHITTKYCFYMVETINFYWDLYNKHGDKYAFIAYNGGEKTVYYKKNGLKSNTSLMKKVNRYDKNIRSLIDKYSKELAIYTKNVRNNHIKEIASLYEQPDLSTNQFISSEKSSTGKTKPALQVCLAVYPKKLEEID